MAPMASKFDGYATNSVITTVAESPALPGVIWAGTDDGNLQVSRDDGLTFTNVVGQVPGVPDGTFVSRVEPSHFDAGHLLRDLRRPPHRRPQAVPVRHARLRPDVAVARGHAARGALERRP